MRLQATSLSGKFLKRFQLLPDNSQRIIHSLNKIQKYVVESIKFFQQCNRWPYCSFQILLHSLLETIYWFFSQTFCQCNWIWSGNERLQYRLNHCLRSIKRLRSRNWRFFTIRQSNVSKFHHQEAEITKVAGMEHNHSRETQSLWKKYHSRSVSKKAKNGERLWKGRLWSYPF